MAFAIHVNLTARSANRVGADRPFDRRGFAGTRRRGLVPHCIEPCRQRPEARRFLAKAFYPEVVRMDLATKHPWRLMLRSAALAGVVALVTVLLVLLVGRPLIQLLFGKEFLGTYPILMVLIIAPVIGIFSFPLPSMLYALDRPTLRSSAGSSAQLSISAHRALVPAVWRVGAAAAFVMGYAAMARPGPVCAGRISPGADYQRDKRPTKFAAGSCRQRSRGSVSTVRPHGARQRK